VLVDQSSPAEAKKTTADVSLTPAGRSLRCRQVGRAIGVLYGPRIKRPEELFAIVGVAVNSQANNALGFLEDVSFSLEDKQPHSK